jgi:hypothetical protein
MEPARTNQNQRAQYARPYRSKAKATGTLHINNSRKRNRRNFCINVNSQKQKTKRKRQITNVYISVNRATATTTATAPVQLPPITPQIRQQHKQLPVQEVQRPGLLTVRRVRDPIASAVCRYVGDPNMVFGHLRFCAGNTRRPHEKWWPLKKNFTLVILPSMQPETVEMATREGGRVITRT